MSTPPPADPPPPSGGAGDEPTGKRTRLWSAQSEHEGSFVADALRQETVGGFLLLAAAIVALIWANVSFHSYESMLHYHVGPLSLEHWAADGGLAVFFFLAGLELKRELVLGSLSNPADALVPVAAAVCGMIVPAVHLPRHRRQSATRASTAGPSRPPPTSPSRWPCSRSSAARCRRRCARSSSPSLSSTTSARSWSSPPCSPTRSSTTGSPASIVLMVGLRGPAAHAGDQLADLRTARRWRAGGCCTRAACTRRSPVSRSDC